MALMQSKGCPGQSAKFLCQNKFQGGKIMLKKFIALTGAMVFTVTSLTATFAENVITVRIDGEEVEFDRPPIVEDGEILVPFRAVMEGMGFYVDWDYVSKIAKISTDDRKFTILVWVDGNSAYYGDVELILGDTEENSRRRYINNDVSAKIVNGRIMIPIHLVSEVFGAEIIWDANSKIVEINRVMKNDDIYEKELRRFVEEEQRLAEEEQRRTEKENLYLSFDRSEFEKFWEEFCGVVAVIDNNEDKLSKEAIEKFLNITNEAEKEFKEFEENILGIEPTREIVDKATEILKEYLTRLKDFAKENGIDAE